MSGRDELLRSCGCKIQKWMDHVDHLINLRKTYEAHLERAQDDTGRKTFTEAIDEVDEELEKTRVIIPLLQKKVRLGGNELEECANHPDPPDRLLPREPQ